MPNSIQDQIYYLTKAMQDQSARLTKAMQDQNALLTEAMQDQNAILTEAIKGLETKFEARTANLENSLRELQRQLSYQSNEYRMLYARMETLEVLGPGLYSNDSRRHATAFFNRMDDPGRSLEDGATDPGYSVYPESTDWN